LVYPKILGQEQIVPSQEAIEEIKKKKKKVGAKSGFVINSEGKICHRGH